MMYWTKELSYRITPRGEPLRALCKDSVRWPAPPRVGLFSRTPRSSPTIGVLFFYSYRHASACTSAILTRRRSENLEALK